MENNNYESNNQRNHYNQDEGPENERKNRNNGNNRTPNFFTLLLFLVLISFCITWLFRGVLSGGSNEIKYNEFLAMVEEGKVEKEKHLDYLKNEKRKEVIEALKAARELGDLSENSEYDAARDAQRKLETEIAMLEETLRVAKIVETSNVKTDVVSVGTKVKLYDIEEEEEVEYSIVGTLESNPAKGLISNQSPIGIALMGKKKGEIVEINAPAGVIQMKVLEISI